MSAILASGHTTSRSATVAVDHGNLGFQIACADREDFDRLRAVIADAINANSAVDE